jgi:hypothetical protein
LPSNSAVNARLAHALPAHILTGAVLSLQPASREHVRDHFIRSKYQRRAFVAPPPRLVDLFAPAIKAAATATATATASATASSASTAADQAANERAAESAPVSADIKVGARSTESKESETPRTPKASASRGNANAANSDRFRYF